MFHLCLRSPGVAMPWGFLLTLVFPLKIIVEKLMSEIQSRRLNWSPDRTKDKRCNDEELHKLIISTFQRKRKKELDIFCFPGDTWEFEKMLLSKTDQTNLVMKFEGIEQNKEVFNNAFNAALQLKQDTKNHSYNIVEDNAFDYLKTTDKKFDIIYLDWLGTWETEKKHELTCIFLRQLFKSHTPGLLILTLCLNQGAHPETTVMQDLTYHIDKQYIDFQFEKCYNGKITENFKRKTYGVANTVAGIGKEHGYKVKVDRFNMYKSIGENHQNWQMSFTFKVS